MWNKIIGGFSFLLLAVSLSAQSTTVTGNVTDLLGNVWINSKVSAVFYPTPNVPGPFTWSGGAFSTTPNPVFTNGSGNFSISLPSNNAIVPSLSQWTIIVCPDATLACVQVNESLNGGTMNISADITANFTNAKVSALFVPKAYASNMVGTVPVNEGAMLYNTTIHDLQFFDGTSWQTIGTGTPGCASANCIVNNPVGTQTITEPSGADFDVVTSVGGKERYNGNEVLTTTSVIPPGQTTGTAIVAGPSGAQTVTQPVNTNNNCVTSGTGKCEYNGNELVTRANAVQTDITTAQAVPIFNATYNAALYGGSDIGAKVNTAEAACNTASPNGPCHIIIPAGTQYSFSTPIVFVNNETVECTNGAVVDNSGTQGPLYQLTYTGTGTAVSMNANAGRFKGCSMYLSSTSAIAGIVMGGYSNWVEDSSLGGGGSATKIVRISNVPGSTSGAEDNHISKSRISNFIGRAIYLDHCNDCFVDDVTAYGTVGNSTGVTLTIDTLAGGATVHNLSGGQSGLHGLVIQNTLGGANPTWMFIDSFISDVATSDGWLFDASLGSGNVGATILNSWSAGSGANGVHLAGGRIITIAGGSKIRTNNLDGILIDNGNVGAVVIADNQILGNNQSNTGGKSGIDVTAHPDGLSIIGNRIGNSPEAGGNQVYALNTSSDIDNITFTGNNCSLNVTGCQNISAIVPGKLLAFGNVGGTTITGLPGSGTVVACIDSNGNLIRGASTTSC